MKLFKMENYQLVISEYAYTIKAFRKLWNRDRSQSKQTAINELAFVYYYTDPRSDFEYIREEEQKIEEIKQSIGLRKNWKPDKEVKEAIEEYKERTKTLYSEHLSRMKDALNRLSQQAASITDFKIEEDGGQLAKTIFTIAERSSKTLKELLEVEKEVTKELNEKEDLRGGSEVASISDKGLSNWL